jgi:aminocarboxymuconate-semialdehyde decarboxylase
MRSVNIDVDSHFTPPEVFEKVKGFRTALRLEMNGYVPGAPYKQGALQGDSAFKPPMTSCIHGHRFFFDPANWFTEKRIEAMKEASFDRQCLISTVPRICMTAEAEAAFERARNDLVAKYVANNPEYFIGVADVPHHDPDLAIEEADRAVKDLGYRAIHIEGSWLSDPLGVQNLATQSWWPFFEKVEELDVPLFVHAVGRGRDNVEFDQRIAAYEQLKNFPGRIAALFGFLIHHQVGIADLIFSGLMDRCPRLQVNWLETNAGWVPSLMSYLDSIYDAYLIYLETGDYFPFVTSEFKEPIRLRKKPSHYLKQNFCYAINYYEEIEFKMLIPMMVNKLGMAKNITVEADWPHEEGSLDIVRRVMSLEIEEKDKLAILGGNAERLLKLEPAPSAYAKAYN